MERPERLRARYSTYWRVMLFPAIGTLVALVVTAAILMATGGVAAAGYSLLVLFLMPPILGGIAIWIAGSSVELGTDTIVRRRWFLLRTTVPVGPPTRGLLARRRDSRGPDFDPALQLRLVAEGRRIRLDGGFWDPADLRRIARHAGEGVAQSTALLDAAGWERRLPGSTTWGERHPVRLGIVLGLGIVAAVVIGVSIAMIALTGSAG